MLAQLPVEPMEINWGIEKCPKDSRLSWEEPDPEGGFTRWSHATSVSTKPGALAQAVMEWWRLWSTCWAPTVCQALGYSSEQARQNPQTSRGKQWANNYAITGLTKRVGCWWGNVSEFLALPQPPPLVAGVAGASSPGWGWELRRHRDPHDVSIKAKVERSSRRWGCLLGGSKRRLIQSWFIHAFEKFSRGTCVPSTLWGGQAQPLSCHYIKGRDRNMKQANK